MADPALTSGGRGTFRGTFSCTATDSWQLQGHPCLVPEQMSQQLYGGTHIAHRSVRSNCRVFLGGNASAYKCTSLLKAVVLGANLHSTETSPDNMCTRSALFDSTWCWRQKSIHEQTLTSCKTAPTQLQPRRRSQLLGEKGQPVSSAEFVRHGLLIAPGLRHWD